VQFAVAVAVTIGQAASTARAEDAARTLVITARAPTGSDAEMVRAVREALSELPQVSLMAPPPLDLEAVQLAIDCTDETASCLRDVAKRMDARVLIVPAIARSDAEVALRILHFDSDKGAEPRTVVQRRTGKSADKDLREAVPEMLRELMAVEDEAKELPAPSESAEEAQPAPEPAVDSAPAPGTRLPVGPLVLGGAGLGVIAAGLVVGALMQQTQNDYADRVIDSEMAAMAAEEDRESGKRQAIVANVLLGAGVAAVAAAGVWFLFDRGEPALAAQTALVPTLGPSSAGVSLVGTWEDR
jgi:hypothetical protein